MERISECVIGPICLEEVAGRCQQAGAECPVKIVLMPIADKVTRALQVMLNVGPGEVPIEEEEEVQKKWVA